MAFIPTQDLLAHPILNYIWDTNTLSWIKQTASAAGGVGLTDAELRASPVPVEATIDTTGLATDAGQTTGNASLASIDGKLLNPLPVSLPDVTAEPGVSLGAALTVQGTGSGVPFPVTFAANSYVSLHDADGDAIEIVNAAPTTQYGIVTRNIPSGTQAVSGPLTDTQLRASAITVTATPFAPVATTVASLPLPSGAAEEATLLTRTKPSDQQHAIIDSGVVTTVGAVTAITNALPAGANAIGKLAANSGVDIGDVDVLTLPAITGTVTANAGTNLNTSLLATSAKQDTLLTELQLKADLTETQPVSLASVPSHAVTNAGTFAVTQATGTNLHAVLDATSTTTVTQATGTNLHAVIDTGSTTAVTGNVAVTNAGLTNLDVALSTRTKPADQQHAIIDSGTTVVTQPTGTNLHAVIDTGSTTAVTGTVTTKEVKAATPAQATVADSATNVTLLASNANRLGATIANDSSAALYLKLGATASLTSYTARVTQYGYYETPFGYTGIIDGIWATDPGDGAARVTELTT